MFEFIQMCIVLTPDIKISLILYSLKYMLLPFAAQQQQQILLAK